MEADEVGSGDDAKGVGRGASGNGGDGVEVGEQPGGPFARFPSLSCSLEEWEVDGKLNNLVLTVRGTQNGGYLVEYRDPVEGIAGVNFFVAHDIEKLLELIDICARGYTECVDKYRGYYQGNAPQGTCLQHAHDDEMSRPSPLALKMLEKKGWVK